MMVFNFLMCFLVCCDVSFYWQAFYDLHLLSKLPCVLPLMETM
jgi:hypothetical protein